MANQLVLFKEKEGKLPVDKNYSPENISQINVECWE